MAYSSYSFRGKRGYRRGGRRAYSRYGKKSSGKKKTTTAMAKGSSRTSMRALEAKIEDLKLKANGEVHKYSFSGLPGSMDNLDVVSMSGGRYYFAVPVSEILRELCKNRPGGAVYVTGISLEGDFFHASPMEWFATCVKVPSATLPPIGVDTNTLSFPLGSLSLDVKGQVHLWPVEDRYVQSVFGGAYTEYARDKSLFHAPMKSGVCPRGNVTFNGSKKAIRHAGRASATLARKGDMSTGLITDSFVKDTFRVWWDINDKVTVCDARGNFAPDRHTILCGARPQVDEGLNAGGKAKALTIAYFKHIRLTLYLRY